MRINSSKLKKYLKNTTIFLFFVAVGIGVLLSIGLFPMSVFEEFPTWLTLVIMACYIFSMLISIDSE